jgi:heptosyltransferase-2
MASALASPLGVRLMIGPVLRLLRRNGRGERLDLARIARILILRLDEIGDVVMTTPVLRELRRNLPQAWITLVVKPSVYNLVERCPHVNEVLVYDWSAEAGLPEWRRRGRAMRWAWAHLWPRRFDLAILPRWDADYQQATFLAYASGARWRVGYSEAVSGHKSRVNLGYDSLLTHVLKDATVKHEVERNLDVLRFLGGSVQEDRLELWLRPEDEVFAGQCLRSHYVQPGDLLIAFGPGAGSPKRMWPLANFLEVGGWLSKEEHARILVIGGKGEEKLGQALRQQLGETVINVVGQTTLRQAGALLKHCLLFVGNDAGPMHLAAAAGVPVIEISCHPHDGDSLHYNSPTRFGPWGVPHRILRPETALEPCSKACLADQAHCIASVEVGQMKEAMLAALSGLRRAAVLAD